MPVELKIGAPVGFVFGAIIQGPEGIVLGALFSMAAMAIYEHWRGWKG